VWHGLAGGIPINIVLPSSTESLEGHKPSGGAVTWTGVCRIESRE
jgi:hypothetical protein